MVQPGMVSCSWTKLLLDMNAEPTVHDDPELLSAIDEGMFRLPKNKSSQDVCADFLRELYSHLVGRLTKMMNPKVFAATPMDCWLTVPAVWSDKARDATKVAAEAAGFGSRRFDKISVISEPEAAALAVLQKPLQTGAYNAPKVCSLPNGKLRG